MSKTCCIEPVNDPTKIGFKLAKNALDSTKVDKKFKLKDQICFGHDVYNLICCRRCRGVGTDQIKECSKCHAIFCESCQIQLNNVCHYCPGSPPIIHCNKKFNELAFNKLRIKHTCRQHLRLERHVLDGLHRYFEIVDPSQELFILLLHDINL